MERQHSYPDQWHGERASVPGRESDGGREAGGGGERERQIEGLGYKER